MKRVIIVHGWGGNPYEPGLVWLKEKLLKQSFEVVFEAMPDPDNPVIETWINALSDYAGKPDESTIFVGHSIGCQTILRYLATLPENIQVGGVVLLTPWYKLHNIDEPEDIKIAEPWENTPIDTEKVKKVTKSISAIFSDDDPYVPIGNVKIFENELGAKTKIYHGKGHFAPDDGVTELPEVLEEVLKLTS